MFLKLFLVIAALFCTAMSADAFVRGEMIWGAVLACCVAVNLINLATAE